MSDHAFPRLFEPVRIRGVSFENRILMAPLTSRYADGDGFATEQQMRYYERRARGGTGGVIVEGASVERRGRGWSPHLSAEVDEAVPGLRALAGRIRRAGSVPILQLMHCGRQTRSEVTGEPPVAPSPIPCPRFGEMPHALSTEEIEEVVEAFTASVRRACEAGFDGVEIHGAHGYLINQFLSPYSNRRDDRYGGGMEGRARFLREILEAARSVLGPRKLLSLRLSGREYVEGGLEPAAIAEIVAHLSDTGVDLVHVSGSVYGSYPKWVGSMPAGSGVEHFVPYAGLVRRRTGLATVAVGRIVEPEQAEAILARGDADFVALGRALIADPAWASKARRGQGDRLWPCIGCGGCNARSWRPEIVCITDPTTGREDALVPPESGAGRGRAVVVGGSVAGVTAAQWLARGGWDVTLLRSRDDRGGLLGARSRVPFLEEFAKLEPFLERRLAAQGIEVVEREGAVGLDDGLVASADQVVWAQAGRHEGLDAVVDGDRRVVLGIDVLRHGCRHGGSVLVAGRGLYAVEVSHLLASHGHTVTLVTDEPEIGFRAHPSTRYWRLESLDAGAIDVKPGFRLASLGDGTAEIVAIDGSERLVLAVDVVVNAQGFVAGEADRGERASQTVPVHWVGDAYDASDLTRLVGESADIAAQLCREGRSGVAG